jgi:hypothetical protein
MTILSSITYTDPRGRVWGVPAGFVTDGASIPMELWGLVGSPFTGKYRVAAVFHDVAYQTLGVAKTDADQMLREASIELGCEAWRADAIYDGVRFGGLDAYTDDQRQAALALNKITTLQVAQQITLPTS